MTDEPRIVQGYIGGITAEGLRRKTEAPLTFVAPPPDPRDATIADMQRRLDENAAVLDQYHKLLVEARNAISMLNGAINDLLDGLEKQA